MPVVSVILPTHDRPQRLPRAVRSVLDQSFGDLELIVVDDGSSVPAEQSLRPLADERMRFLRSGEAEGPSRARNRGLEAARGAWIAFQDDDDEWLPGKLERQMELASRAGQDVGVVYCPFWRVEDDGRRHAGARPVRKTRGSLHEEQLRGSFIGLPTAVVRRECFEAVGTFDDGLPCFEDWELFIRIAGKFRFECVDEPLVLAHHSPQSVNQAASSVQADAFARILDTHHEAIEGRPAVQADFLFHIAHHLCVSGKIREGRAHLRRALRLAITPRAVVTLAATYLGGGAYRALARAYDGYRDPRRAARTPRPAD